MRKQANKRRDSMNKNLNGQRGACCEWASKVENCRVEHVAKNEVEEYNSTAPKEAVMRQADPGNQSI